MFRINFFTRSYTHTEVCCYDAEFAAAVQWLE